LNSQPKASFKSADVSLPTSPAMSATLYWLETHQAKAPAPPGIRYLHLRNRLKENPAAAGELLTTEAKAYESAFSEIEERFARASDGLAFDLVVESPSCAPHASEFAEAASRAHPKAVRAAFDYDCVNGKRKNAAKGASVSELEAAMTPRKPFPKLDQAKSVLIVDDIFNDGDTAAAVLHTLWAGGLNRRASILVAVPLRVMPSETQPKYDFSGVLEGKNRQINTHV
jgi:hypothetical protein